MAIAFRSESHDIAFSSSPLVMSEPSGVVQGDLLVSLFTMDSGQTYSLPAGWTSIYNGDSFTPNFRYNLAYVVRGASAPSLTWTFSGSPYHELHILAFSGVSTSAPVDANTQVTSFSASNTNPDPPSVTAVSSAAMALAIGINWNGSSISGSGWIAPSGYTLRSNNALRNDCAIATKLLSSSGAEDPGAYSGVATTGIGDIWEATVTLAPVSSTIPLQWVAGINGP